MALTAKKLTARVKSKIDTLRRELCVALRKECLEHFRDSQIRALPVLLFRDSLSREFAGKEIRLVSRHGNVNRQKVSLKVGSKEMSIGDCDSEDLASIVEFVKKRNLKNAS